MESPVTRFAPSPTGYLHLGHVVNAIVVWGQARAIGARVLLRIEDHDRLRSRPEYEAALLEDLAWLGFAADAASTSMTSAWTPQASTVPPVATASRTTILRQSDDSASYAAALEALRSTARVYACDCSRKEIGGECYSGRCRERGLVERPGLGVRVVFEPGVERFEDLRLGPQEQSPSDQCGDLLLRDRDGHWTYQFAVTVDDIRHGVTLVIRGADLLPSTGRQMRLARMLGRTELPRFLHHALIVHPSGEKLSKSSGDTGVRELRAAGVSAAEVIGRAAAAAGLIDRPRPIRADEVGGLFLPL
jgi:glutamyl-tRNA synthetase/glutamyl-Q tRNA(Asp) synthetase